MPIPGTERHGLISLSFQAIASLAKHALSLQAQEEAQYQPLVSPTLALLFIHLKKGIYCSGRVAQLV